MLFRSLFMTVKPGFYGGTFLPKTLEKVRKLRHLAPDINIEVDGGINPETIKHAQEAGANLFVVGSFIMKSGSPEEAFKNISSLLN